MANHEMMNTKPNQKRDWNSLCRKSATKTRKSEGMMAQNDNYPKVSKTANAVVNSLKQQVLATVLGPIKIAGVATSLLLASTNAAALGLGALDIQSNLDQPLNGLIAVNLGPSDDVSTINAVVASREEFETLGIDYPEYLKDISLTLERDSGTAALRVSSEGVVINEPFIHFLVKIDWAGGSFLREYTALIDPPVYAAEAPKSVAQPKAVGTDQDYVDSYDDSPVVDTSDESIADDVIDQVDTVSEASTLNDDAVVAEDVDSVEGAGEATDARYGPVAGGESLSGIAQELQRQVPDLSIYSIMKVLFDENPDAFIGSNINGLIKGSILNIGDLDQIRGVDIVEARTFFQEQVAEWDPSSLIASSDSGIGVGQDNYSPDDDLFGSDSGSATGSSTDSFQVGASDTDSFVSASDGGRSEGEFIALREELSQMQGSLASSELENQELKARVALLEGQLQNIEDLKKLNVEDSDLAALTKALSDDVDSSDVSAAVDASADSAISEFLDDETTAFDDSDSLGVDDAISEFLEDPAPEVDVADEFGETAEDPFSDSLAVNDDQDPVIDADDAPVESVIEEVTDQAVASTPVPITTNQAESDSLMDKLGGGLLLPIAGGLGALIVGGLGLFLFRRRRADEEFEISMLSIESNSQSIDLDTESGMSASMSASHTASMMELGDEEHDPAAEADKETSFLTVYSDSDAVVQADEVDPIAEADVYIAYGRDEQAEEVLLDGITSHPERADVKHKLLGLYYKNKNAEGFERIAEELFTQRDSLTGDMWQEISDMGLEIAPDNPLFSMSGIDFDVVEQASENLDEGDDDVEIENSTTEIDDSPLAFDAATSDSDAVGSSSDDAESAGEVVLTTVDADEENAGDESEMIVDSLNEDASIQLINFDDGRSEISELDEVEIDALVLGESEDDGLLEFDVSANADENKTELNVNEALDTAATDLDADDLVLDFDELEEEADDGASEERDFNEVAEVSDLVIDSEYDESRTQFELAKVFVDLGDADGARKILEDLIADSNNSDEIVAESKELLDSMNS